MSLIALAIAACGQPRTFVCASDGECVLATVPGRCEADGACSFPDVTCQSGARYGVHAPATIRDTCVPLPSNDACDQPASLELGVATAGDLRAGSASGLLACSAASADVFYELNLPECSDVTLRAEAPSGNLGVGLVRDCSETLACADVAPTSMAESTSVFGLPAGTYQVAVGGVGYDGAFTVTAEVAPPPSNDTIATAIPLASGERRLDSLARASDQVTCGGRTGGRDLVYSINVPSSSSSRAVIEVDVTGVASTDFAVALLDAAGNEIACADASTGPVRFYEVDPGPYFLAVDGPTDGSCGQFNLTAIVLRVPKNNRCTTAQTLCTLPVDLVNQRFDDATNDSVGACGGSGGDVVYALRVAQDSQLRITVTETGGVFTPVVYLREMGPLTACGAPPIDATCFDAPDVMHRPRIACTPGRSDLGVAKPPEAACATGAAVARLDVEHVSPGWYQVVVDSDGGTGEFRLQIDRTLPAGNLVPGIPIPEVLPDGLCFDADNGCCDVESTVNATRDPLASSCVAALPDLFRTVAVPNNCLTTGDFVVVGTVPHAAELTSTGSCPGLTATCRQPTDAVLGLDGNYRTIIPVMMSSYATNCQLRLRVFAPSDAATRGPIAIHFSEPGSLVCLP